MDNFWGTLPDWLVGLGTIALATVTFVGLIRERREKRRLQEKLDRQEQAAFCAAAERDRRAQAEQVVAWTAEQPAGTRALMEGGYSHLPGGMMSAVVQNDSSLPITNVNIHWQFLDGTADIEVRNIPTIPPRSHEVYVRPGSLFTNGEMPVEIDFHDSRGVVWKRARDGKITEIG